MQLMEMMLDAVDGDDAGSRRVEKSCELCPS